jgi:(p)ppGpp synthase/HD superfamily hydrolase
MSHFLLQEAYDIANQAHRLQYRKKSGLPYIVHPCKVASKLAGLGDDTLTSVGFLHDVLEDCRDYERGYYVSRIEGLQKGIIDYVKELTFTGKTKQEKEDYLASFKTKSMTAYIVKVVDRVDNIEDFMASGDKEYAKIYAKKAEILTTKDTYKAHEDNILQCYGSSIQSFVKSQLEKIKGYYQ